LTGCSVVVAFDAVWRDVPIKLDVVDGIAAGKGVSVLGQRVRLEGEVSIGGGQQVET
jgi:hypothetical protein